MNIQLADLTSNTGLTFHNLEQELSFLDSLQPSKKKPEYWHTLGSSKSRTTDQERLSRELVTDIVGSCSTDTTICFTDGSCLGNPGPCGAGACIFLPGAEEPVCLKKPVSSRGSILLGEIVAIQMAVENTYNAVSCRGNITSKLHIFSDSQSAIGILSLGWEATSHKTTVKQVKHIIFKLKQSSVDLEISWTPGHADIKGNELADSLAKEAAEEAKELDDSSVVVTMEDVKSAAKNSGIKKWQDMWDKSERGRALYSHRPEVDFKLKHSFKTTKGEKAISQLRTGYTSLNEYLFKCGLTDSDKCECGEIETRDHFLLQCPIYERQREFLRKRLFQQLGIVSVDSDLLLNAKNEKEANEMRSEILSALENFVEETQRFYILKTGN